MTSTSSSTAFAGKACAKRQEAATCTLATLQDQLPATLRLLRLRFRFPVPQVVAWNEWFRVSLDVVDEMGQSLLTSRWSREFDQGETPCHCAAIASSTTTTTTTTTTAKPLLFSLHFSLAQEGVDQPLALQLEAVPCRVRSSRELLFKLRLNHKNRIGVSTRRLRLQVELQDHYTTNNNNKTRDDDHGAERSVTVAQTALAEFCVGSTWLADRQTLVLSVRSHVIQVCDATSRVRSSTNHGKSLVLEQVQRCFQIVNCSAVVCIQENYGDSMGSHIWDASILLAFAFCATFETTPSCNRSELFRGLTRRFDQQPMVSSRGSVLEISAGCGLVGITLALLFEAIGPGPRVIVTEQPQSVPLLTHNVQANRLHHTLQAVELMWEVFDHKPQAPVESVLPKNSLPLHLIVASDVLYNSRNHGKFLGLLQHLTSTQCTSNNTGNQSGHNAEQRFGPLCLIAYKHRSGSTKQFVQDLVDANKTEPTAGSIDDTWSKWRVERLASIGTVELLRVAFKS